MDRETVRQGDGATERIRTHRDLALVGIEGYSSNQGENGKEVSGINHTTGLLKNRCSHETD
jgi:hypothetical protein